jgi:uncharacterized protein (TIGR00159 family)
MLDRLLGIFDDATTTWGVLLILADIALVYWLIYRSLLMIRGERALQTLIGMLGMAVLYFASRGEYLGLTALNWVLERFLSAFIIIAVVLFQEDIRRGLSQMGRSRSLSNLSEGEHAHFLEEVVKAAQLMSERRVGALVVIERTDALDELIVSGVHIDAQVSKELLFALFLPLKANPTHDGAVLIQQGRLTWAACFLPLSRNAQIEKVLGTRHRAAIGLSEQTDAVVVVVSEETGAVSVAFQEELYRGLDAAALRAQLQKCLIADAREPSSPRRSRVEGAVVQPVSAPVLSVAALPAVSSPHLSKVSVASLTPAAPSQAVTPPAAPAPPPPQAAAPAAAPPAAPTPPRAEGTPGSMLSS